MGSVFFITLFTVWSLIRLRVEILGVLRDAGREVATAHTQLKRKWNPPAKSKEVVSEEQSGRPPSAPDVCPVVLKGPNAKPIVLGVQQEKPLTQAQYDVVKALVDAFPAGYDKWSLTRNHKDARNILKLVSKKSKEWKQVIIFPGSAGGGGYRIAIPESR